MPGFGGGPLQCRRNHTDVDQVSGLPYTSKHLLACYDRAAELAGWADRDALRTPQPHGHMRWLDPAIIAAIFSMRGGLLPWVPVLYLFVPGLFLARRPLAGLAGPLLALFAVELWVNASACCKVSRPRWISPLCV